MKAREFAQEWLKQEGRGQEGLFSPETDYGGDIARDVLAVVDLIEKQNHSGGSMFQLLNTIRRLYDAYNNRQHPIWLAWRKEATRHR